MIIRIHNAASLTLALAALSAREMPFTISINGEKRSLQQNDMIWWLNTQASEQLMWGTRGTPEQWHEAFKRKFLPEEPSDETSANYVKWEPILGTDDRRLVGSTTQLTVAGCATYITQILAFFGELGVELPASEMLTNINTFRLQNSKK